MGESSSPLDASVYERATQFLPHRIQKELYRCAVSWQEVTPGEAFWYRVEGADGPEYVFIDVVTGERSPLLDLERLRNALPVAEDRSLASLNLRHVFFDQDTDRVEFAIDDEYFVCQLPSYACEKVGRLGPEEVLSPDRRWVAYLNNYDLWVRPLAGGREIPLTTDGTPTYRYAYPPTCTLTDEMLEPGVRPQVVWSPDSTRLLSYRLDERYVERTTIMQSVPRSGYRAWGHEYPYPQAGDVHVPLAHMVLLNRVDGSRRDIEQPLLALGVSPITQGLVSWSADGERAYLVQIHRGYRRVSLLEVDGHTGQSSVLLEETDSHCCGPFLTHSDEPIYWMAPDGEDFLWLSERDGWGHLYWYRRDGTLRGQVTSGAFVVRDILHVDRERDEIYLSVGGLDAGDPYYRHLVRTSFSGKTFDQLTQESADHDLRFSASGRYLLDTFSRVDSAPKTVLRRNDGSVEQTLESAELQVLKDLQWTPPQPFSVRSADDTADLYGVLFFPSNFDSNQCYPVIDVIYPGPQTIRSPKRFPGNREGHWRFWEPQALAELGFVVVTLDGYGTPYRSRAFMARAFGPGFESAGGLDDHVAGIRKLCERYAFMDEERVGICGHSGGGYASTRAMLQYPEFFKVAVSSAGNHDQRSYMASWGELWIGLLDGDNYDHQANVELVDQLQGKLLLVHGDLDDNVHPALTYQLVYALIEANKDFDFLVLPGRNHGLIDLTKEDSDPELRGDPYFTRRLWDYFVTHLMGQRPPKEFMLRDR